jgi:hypothetical protein
VNSDFLEKRLQIAVTDDEWQFLCDIRETSGQTLSAIGRLLIREALIGRYRSHDKLVRDRT